MHAVAVGHPAVNSVSIYVTVGIVAVTALVAWYGRHLAQTVADVRSAKARLAGARKARWGAWRIMVPVAFVAVIAADVWLRHG